MNYSPAPTRGLKDLPPRKLPAYPDILLDIQYVHDVFEEGSLKAWEKVPTVYFYAYTVYKGTLYSEKWTKGNYEDKSVGQLCDDIMARIHQNIALHNL